MSKFATSLLTLAMYTTALVVVPMATPAEAATSSGKHTKHKKKIRPGFSDSWSAGWARPVTGPPGQAGEVCPGIARSFDCRTWPPPIYDDPDRRVPARR